MAAFTTSTYSSSLKEIPSAAKYLQHQAQRCLIKGQSEAQSLPPRKIMAFLRVLAVAAAATFTALAAPSVEASMYPPNYQVQSDCKQDGPVKVCAINKDYNVPRLLVEYTGYLHNETPGKVNAWVKLNSRTGTFKLTNISQYEYKVIGDLQNVTCCWSSDPPLEEERALFFYAYDQNGKANAWDVEVALFNEEKKWDSKYGANYKFRL